MVRATPAPKKEEVAPPAKTVEEAPKAAPVQQYFPAPPPNVAGAAAISIAMQSAASKLAGPLRAAATTQINRLRGSAGRAGMPMIAPRSPLERYILPKSRATGVMF